MTSDPEGSSAGDAITPEAKPKAKPRKKRAAEPVEAATEPTTAEAATSAGEPAKPAKKVTRKPKPAEEIAEATTASAEPDPEEAAPETPKLKKAAKAKTAKKEKGRDLVVDSPGAEEVAEVLSHTAEAAAEEADEEPPAEAKGPAPKLERLQKILAKAGISSRRKAEELILGGLVQINGKVVMELGTKADPARDHVRVDGKLLQGPERLRYFVLNKPKGYVTTVSDPEGRPTVMQFFTGERERLYPVGRLDYLSEGLLLVTNDGELASKLTKASSGVEKTYLVKVAGQPTEAGLDALRAGVVIERGRGIGSGRVRTAPAQIRQVRQGDNPWYEVIVIEGRNRELRKMFEEIGHHVEKIRRIGYGPLVLDQEPGKLRELEAEEVHSLRLASEGKLKTRRRRGPAPAQLPTVAGKTVRYKKADGKPGFEPRFRKESKPEFPADAERGTGFKAGFKPAFKPEFKRAVRPEFQQESKSEFRPGIKSIPKAAFKPTSRPGQFQARTQARTQAGSQDRPRTPGSKPGFAARGSFPAKPRRAEPPVTDYVLPPRKAGPPEPESEFNPDYKPGFRTGAKPEFRSEGRPQGRPGSRSGSTPEFRNDRPAKPFRPAGPRKDFVRPARPADDDDFVPTKTPGFRIEPVEDRAEPRRPARPFSGGSKPFRPAGPRPTSGDRPFNKTRADRPASSDRPFRPRPTGPGGAASPRGTGFRPAPDRAPGRDSARGPARGPARSFENRPARGTDRPGSKPFRPRTDGPPIGRPKPFGTRDGAAREDRPREFRPRTERPFDGPPKKFAGARQAGPGGPVAGGKPKAGPDGEPRKKERWRNSFTGKNKGRPKPKKRD
jgi:23S rRNA pseudouridine2605 synthase